MALKVSINQEGGGITLIDETRSVSYFLGIEDIRLQQKDSTKIQVELENPEILLQTVYDTSQGEMQVAGVVSATPGDAITAFGALIATSRSDGDVTVLIDQSDVTKFFSFRNPSIVIGDTSDNIVLLALKKTGQGNARIKNIVVNIILESKDFVEVQYHKNPTIVGGGSLTYSLIPGSLFSGANGSTGNPSDTLIGNSGNPFQVIGYCEEKNYGKEFHLQFSIEIDNTNDEHVFSLICSGNDTKTKGSIHFEQEII
jgi:hypothetical protein